MRVERHRESERRVMREKSDEREETDGHLSTLTLKFATHARTHARTQHHRGLDPPERRPEHLLRHARTPV